ncbi:putative ribonuclease H-like domain-containing protein [Tanacetum coccineum]|uniref:Ribonuclease H-like domain-containing protein n=1 Tax=Tanacetum coccineum TaxID=301880 RepID=A0ABQ4WGQ9_9ASTR
MWIEGTNLNKDVIENCGFKRETKREYSNAKTPQQNGVAKRKNRTLIEAARTILADSFLPNTSWAEAVSTACYVLNRVLSAKPHNKTPMKLLMVKRPINCTKDKIVAVDSEKKMKSAQEQFRSSIMVIPISPQTPLLFSSSKQIKREEVQERKNKSFWMILQDFKGRVEANEEAKKALQQRSLNKKMRT